MQRYILFVFLLLSFSGCALSTLPGTTQIEKYQREESSKRREAFQEKTARPPVVSLPLGVASHLYLGPCL